MTDDDQNDSTSLCSLADNWAQGLGVSVQNFVQGTSDPGTSDPGSSDPGTSDPGAFGPPLAPAPAANSAGAAVDAGSADYQQGYQDGLSGGDENPSPRAGDALEQYSRGYAEGHEEFSRKNSSDPGPNSSEGPPLTLDQKYRAAVQNEDWQQAAEFLNGFSREDIQSRLSELTPDMVASLHQGALDNPRLGSNSQVAQMTRNPDDDRLDANLQDDPNTVFAGEHFKIKMLDGFTTGEVLGVGSFLFAIWDIDNNRLANYEFDEVIVTFGAPISDCGEGDWSETFTTSKPMQVDQFAGTARLAEASAALVGVWNLHIAAAGVAVSVPTVFNKSFGVDTGTGPFVLTPGSVKVFKG
ncbi:MAG TPA: hypothetical protein VFE51_27370 [Verrucomicrobiae bacterium]|nr:hypothetical protein [Verrucomicrobiae bacterium]